MNENPIPAPLTRRTTSQAFGATTRAWKLVGQYSTYEAACATVARLRAAGVESAVSMIGGMSVVQRA